MRTPWMLPVLLLVCRLSATCADELAPLPQERHFKSLRALTAGGINAEAYWSADGKRIVFMSQQPGDAADQIYTMELATGAIARVSNGEGRTTCGYFLPDGRIVYSSTHHHGKEPPTPPDKSKGYVWPLYSTYDIFLAESAGGPPRQLTDSDGYDAEATVSPDGKRIIFTSLREKGMWLYTMDPDGGNLRRVGHRWGYVGGPFFSPDSQWIVYRGWFPDDEEKSLQLSDMLAECVLRPKGMKLEIYLSRPDGSEERALTDNGKINFAPCFTADGKRILFDSNLEAKHPGNYSMYLVGTDGKGLERVTYGGGFDGFPHFSPDGRHLLFISDRNAKAPHELNVLVAEWQD